MLLMRADAAAPSYRLIDLATLSQSAPVVLRGPNIAGIAVGGGKLHGGPGGGRRGLFLQGGAAARNVAPLPDSDDANVLGGNDIGGLVGSANTATSVRAFASTPAGGAQELPPLAGDNASVAYSLNNRGQAVGFSSGASGERAVSWVEGGTPSALPGTGGMTSSRALWVNERGDVAGVAVTPAGRRAIYWPGGGPAIELTMLAGHVASEAFAVNARGDVVGYSAPASGQRRATLWPSGSPVVDLGTLPGGDFSQAFGSNAAGDVVGSSGGHEGDRAFLWTRSAGLQDLNSLIPPSQVVLTKAVGINNAGMIVAMGYDASAAAAQLGEGHSHVEAHELPVRVFLLVRSGGA